jgi:hypothetical protein
MRSKTGRYQNVLDAFRIFSALSWATKIGRYQNVAGATRGFLLTL